MSATETPGTAAALFAAGTLFVAQHVRRGNAKQAKSAHALPRLPAAGQVSVHDVLGVDRADIPFRGIEAFHLRDQGTSNDITLEALLQRKDVVLYCWTNEAETAADEMGLFFVQIADMQALDKHPFLDRGVRAHAGGTCYYTRLSGAEALLERLEADIKPQSITFVWNTGRCGSTLMHRLLSAGGACSLSEPFWLDQLSFPFTRAKLGGGDKQDRAAKRLFRACVAVDFTLAAGRMPKGWTGQFSLNPKSHVVMVDAAIDLYPGSRHMFMYRDCTKVVESFSSIFIGHLPPMKQRLAKLQADYRRWLGTPGTLGDFAPFASARLTELAQPGSGGVAAPPIRFPREQRMAHGSANWLDACWKWQELREEGRTLPPGSSRAAAGSGRCEGLTLRMDEFVGKSDAVKKGSPEWFALVAVVLRFAGLLPEDVARSAQVPRPEASPMSAALAVFERGSQVGSKMESSSTAVQSRLSSSARVAAKFHGDQDLAEVAATFEALSTAHRARWGSERLPAPSSVLPGSLGCTPSGGLLPSAAWASLA